MTDEDADRFERVAVDLTAMVSGLREDMAKAQLVRDDLAKLTQSGKLTRMIVVVLAIVLVGVLSVGAVQFINVRTLNNVVTVQRDSALCPLYQLFLNSDTPAGRAAAERRGDDLVQRDKAFLTIRQSYTALNCQAE